MIKEPNTGEGVRIETTRDGQSSGEGTPWPKEMSTGITNMSMETGQCFHMWRIIHDFFTEMSRDKRLYAVYCTRCLMSKVVEINKNLEKKKNNE